MIFIDTGAFLARYLPTDQYHARAVSAWQRIATSHEKCATSAYVLSETFTLLARRSSYSFAAERARLIGESKAIEILRPSEIAERDAIDLFEKFADQRVSFTDCLSFALMRQARIRRAFSFDRHFVHAGFELWPAGR